MSRDYPPLTEAGQDRATDELAFMHHGRHLRHKHTVGITYGFVVPFGPGPVPCPHPGPTPGDGDDSNAPTGPWTGGGGSSSGASGGATAGGSGGAAGGGGTP